MANRGDHRDDLGAPMCAYCRRDRAEGRRMGACPFCRRIFALLRKKIEPKIEVDIPAIREALRGPGQVICQLKIIDSKYDPDINFHWEPAIIIGIDLLGEMLLVQHNLKQYWYCINKGSIKYKGDKNA